MIADDIAIYNKYCVHLPGLLRVELGEQAHERLRRMHRDGRPGKVALVAGDNALGVSLATRLNDYGVFKVGQGAVGGALQSRSVHGRHFKDRKQGGNVPPGVSPAHGLLRQVEDRRERVGARQSLNLAPVGSREKIGGGIRKRRSIKQKIDQDIGIEEDLHRICRSFLGRRASCPPWRAGSPRLHGTSLGTRASRPRRGRDGLAPSVFPARQRSGARCENSQPSSRRFPLNHDRSPHYSGNDRQARG